MSRKLSGTDGSGRLASTAPAAALDSWPAWSEVWPEPLSLASKLLPLLSAVLPPLYKENHPWGFSHDFSRVTSEGS